MVEMRFHAARKYHTDGLSASRWEIACETEAGGHARLGPLGVFADRLNAIHPDPISYVILTLYRPISLHGAPAHVRPGNEAQFASASLGRSLRGLSDRIGLLRRTAAGGRICGESPRITAGLTAQSGVAPKLGLRKGPDRALQAVLQQATSP